MYKFWQQSIVKLSNDFRRASKFGKLNFIINNIYRIYKKRKSDKFIDIFIPIKLLK